VRLAPGMLDTARPHMDRMLAASRAEASCRAYSYAIDVQDTTLVHVFEVWDSHAHLDAHFRSDHIAAWPTIGFSDRNPLRCDVAMAEPV